MKKWLPLMLVGIMAAWFVSTLRPPAAKTLLQPVYDRFTEGFATADLRQAKTLLNQLA